MRLFLRRGSLLAAMQPAITHHSTPPALPASPQERLSGLAAVGTQRHEHQQQPEVEQAVCLRLWWGRTVGR